MSNPRVLAVDWSGAIVGASSKIWLAEATPDGAVVRLESGRDREALVAHLMEEATRTPDLVVGLDFAFSVPEWYLASRNLPNAPALWALAAQEGEHWLAECAPPFWGMTGRCEECPF